MLLLSAAIIMCAGCLQSQAMENNAEPTTPAAEETVKPANTPESTAAAEETVNPENTPESTATAEETVNPENTPESTATAEDETESEETNDNSGLEEPAAGELSNSSESNPYLPVVVCENITPVEYRPIWPAGTILSDAKGESKGIITKVDHKQNKYYFRNLILPPENGEPYLLKDNSFEQMGPVFDSKSIEEKYPGYEGKMMKITIYGRGAIKSETGYLEYDTKESMKHTSAD
ncbi:hypothetical protein Metlim_0322 [Methanoplanus limicola DSM 2279]|uniref:Uncharacterized protein n=2 Tax=Methanoplanus limicola TaxID=2315 RepID=H1Z0Y7_9EURY|nr:hypothetical protein Metlim_0322 [Methanoplanus limicola DSM 2279]